MPIAEFKFPPKVSRKRQRDVAAILWTLHYDGSIEDKSGLAGGLLRTRLSEKGTELSVSNLNAILKLMDHPGAEYGHFVDRHMNERKTYRIRLQVDPFSVPFPKDPYGGRTAAAFSTRNTRTLEAPVRKEAPDDELEETFSRQALLEGLAASTAENKEDTPVDLDDDVEEQVAALRRWANEGGPPPTGPTPERVPVPEPAPAPEPEPEPVVVQVPAIPEPAPASVPAHEPIGWRRPVRPDPAVNGDLVFSDAQIAALLTESDASTTATGSAMEMLTNAMTLIGQAMAKQVEEATVAPSTRPSPDELYAAIDERMGAYWRQNERIRELETKLTRSHDREKDLIKLCKYLQAQVRNLTAGAN